MKNAKDIKLIEVFAGTIWEAGVVKSLLENAEIEVYLKDEVRGTLAPWHVAPGGVGAVKIIVADSDLEKAQIVISDFEKNTKEDNSTF
jgi:hypothetical protein